MALFITVNFSQGSCKRVKCKLACNFSAPTRYESVGCDDGRFIFPKECDSVAMPNLAKVVPNDFAKIIINEQSIKLLN